MKTINQILQENLIGKVFKTTNKIEKVLRIKEDNSIVTKENNYNFFEYNNIKFYSSDENLFTKSHIWNFSLLIEDIHCFNLIGVIIRCSEIEDLLELYNFDSVINTLIENNYKCSNENIIFIKNTLLPLISNYDFSIPNTKKIFEFLIK